MLSFVAFRDQQAQYLEWARATFSEEQVRALDFDEAGYPRWASVEAEFAAAAHARRLQQLEPDDLRALLYLIARSWDVGRILAWLSTRGPLSAIAELSDEDALFLAEASLRLDGPELDDAHYQLAVLMPRIASDPGRVQALLLSFYERPHEYTKRCALLALARIGYPHLGELARRSWQIVDEHHRIAVLEVLAKQPEPSAADAALLDELLEEARHLPGEYLATARAAIEAQAAERQGTRSH